MKDKLSYDVHEKILDVIKEGFEDVISALGGSRKGSEGQQLIGQALKELLKTNNLLNEVLQKEVGAVAYLGQSNERLAVILEKIYEKSNPTPK